jgi:hypothetical protein
VHHLGGLTAHPRPVEVEPFDPQRLGEGAEVGQHVLGRDVARHETKPPARSSVIIGPGSAFATCRSIRASSGGTAGQQRDRP